MEITGGTDKGTMYQGKLLLAETTATEGAGVFTRDDGTKLPVVVTVADGNMNLQVMLPTGQAILGKGPFTGSLAACRSRSSGSSTRTRPARCRSRS